MADRSWSFMSMLSSINNHLPSLSSVASMLPTVSFTNADGSPRYGLIALTTGVAAGSGYFLLRSIFAGNTRYPYHLIAGADGTSIDADVNRNAFSTTNSEGESSPRQQRQHQNTGEAVIEGVGGSDTGPRQLQVSQTHPNASFSINIQKSPLIVVALFIILVLISVALGLSVHDNGVSGIFFWEWFNRFPLFLPLFFTALGISGSELIRHAKNPPANHKTPTLKSEDCSPKSEQYNSLSASKDSFEAAKSDGDSGGEFKSNTGDSDRVEFANESKGSEDMVSAKGGSDSFASIDELWQKSEKGEVTKMELLNAVMSELQNTQSCADSTLIAEISWRAARAMSNLASWDPYLDKKEKKKYIDRGLELAQQSVHHASSGSSQSSATCQANAYKFLSILQGQSTAFLGTKEGMVLADEIRKNMETALNKNPSDAMLHYMLATWKFNVAGVPYAIRYGASWISGVLLEADFESALADIQKALEIGGCNFYIDIHMLHAKLLLKIGGAKSMEMAKQSLEKASTMKVISPSDKQIKLKAERLLAQGEIKVI